MMHTVAPCGTWGSPGHDDAVLDRLVGEVVRESRPGSRVTPAMRGVELER